MRSDDGSVADGTYTPSVPCFRGYAHEPHPYISVIVGGEPGPCPQITCLCPGVTADPDVWVQADEHDQ